MNIPVWQILQRNAERIRMKHRGVSSLHLHSLSYMFDFVSKYFANSYFCRVRYKHLSRYSVIVTLHFRQLLFSSNSSTLVSVIIDVMSVCSYSFDNTL